MAVPINQLNLNNPWYDPYADRMVSQEHYMREMQRQQANAYQSALGNQGLMQRADPPPNPVSQPEPFLNPVLLLLE